VREIKFRGWDKEAKRMFIVNDIEGLRQNTLWRDKNGNIELWDDQVEIMQYTGLKDKNGKEIYEGDIITGETWYESENDAYQWTRKKPAIVEWSKGSICGFYPFYLNARFKCDVKDIEVIGNVWENKELLDTKREVDDA